MPDIPLRYASVTPAAPRNPPAKRCRMNGERGQNGRGASSASRDREPAADARGGRLLGGAVPSGPCRIALYSPGMVGIGHMRRNLLIAQTLAGSPLRAAILMIAEAREANVLTLPPGGDCLTLPALRKEFDGQCRPRYLDTSLAELVALRSRVIEAALEMFRPDVLVVDHLPRGALRELDPTLEGLRAGGHTRCVLGLRDVLEDPARVRQDWADAANEDAIRDY